MNRVTSRFVTTASGVKIRVVLRGTGPTLMLVNGIGGHTAMWEPLAKELSLTRQLVLFDAPGCGESPPLTMPKRMAGLATLVGEVLDALGLDQVDLLGYSWGGALAQQIAHDMPHRVRRLVLVSTVAGLGGRPPGLRVSIRMLTPTRYRSSQDTHTHAAELYGGDNREGSTSAASGVLQRWNEFPPGIRSYTFQLFALAGWSSLPWLRKLKPATLIISGDDDPLVPTINAHLLARRIPTSDLRLIPGGGHLWLLEHASESSAIIERFLTDA